MTNNTFLLAWTVQIMHNYPLFLPTVPALNIFSVIYAAFLQQRAVRAERILGQDSWRGGGACKLFMTLGTNVPLI